MVIRILLVESAMRCPQAAPLNPPNTWEWIAPSRAQASIVTGSSVTSLNAGRLQHRRELVDLAVKLLVGDHNVGGVLGFGDPDQRGLVLVLGQVPVNAVV